MVKRPKTPEGRSRGTVKELSAGKYLVRYFIGNEVVNGKKKRKYGSEVVKGTKSQANKKLTEKLSELDTDTFVQPNTLTLDAFMDLWFAAKTDLAARTLETYRHRYKMDLQSTFGHRKLSELTKATPQFQAHYNTLVKPPRNLSRSTVQYSNMILKQAFEDAIEWQYMSRNPLRRVAIPRSDSEGGRKQKNMDVLTPLQVEKFLMWAESNDTVANWALWTVLFTSGIRPQEAFALTWDDFTVRADGRAFLAINKAAVQAGNTFSIGDTKTFTARGTISIPLETVRALKKHRAAHIAFVMSAGENYDRDSQLIFGNAVGGIQDISKVRKRFAAALRRSKTKPIRLYDTRHTHATGLLIAGVHIKVVSERLRHKSTKITLDTYSHIIPEMSEATADVVGETFFGGARKTGEKETG